MKLDYPAIFKKEEDGRYSVSFPDVPEALTCGTSYDHAIEMAHDCLQLCLAGRIEDGEKIPQPHFENIKPKINEVVVSIEFIG